MEVNMNECVGDVVTHVVDDKTNDHICVEHNVKYMNVKFIKPSCINFNNNNNLHPKKFFHKHSLGEVRLSTHFFQLNTLFLHILLALVERRNFLSCLQDLIGHLSVVSGSLQLHLKGMHRLTSHLKLFF